LIRKLFSANPARMPRCDGPPKKDAVPASLVDGTPDGLKADLIALLGKQNVLHRAIDLVRFASDASPYRLVPQVVVQPRTTDDIVRLFRYCRENGRHATLRAAGTSLNGQSQSDDILIDVRRHWYGAKVEEDGGRVRARTGIILGHVNAMLARYGRRVGPDPASSSACTIGGVIANNSGGMRCTVKNDAYQTVSAMTFVMPSGAVISTSAPGAEAAFERAEPDLAIGLLELRGQLLADRELVDRVRRKYAIRNTHGYRLCSTARRHSKSFVVFWWDPRERWRSSPRPSSTPFLFPASPASPGYQCQPSMKRSALSPASSVSEPPPSS
jgi:D-lactate dehydrogenase